MNLCTCGKPRKYATQCGSCYKRQYYATHPKIKEYYRKKTYEWLAAHPAERKLIQNRATAKWVAKPENKKKLKEYQKKYYELNKKEINRKSYERAKRRKLAKIGQKDIHS